MMVTETPATSMAASARLKVQGVWAQLRSMTSMEEDRLGALYSSRSESSGNEEVENGVFEGMMKTVFGSCTAGNFRSTSHPDLVQTSTRSSSWKHDRSVDNSASLKRRGPGAHYVVDDHARAAHVVNGMREQKELERSSRRQRKATSPIESTALTKPFPVSSPKRHSSPLHITPALVTEIPAPDNALNGTFDDGISAISAYTLEEMALQEELERPTNLLPVRSDLTQETFEDVFSDPNQSTERFAMSEKKEPSKKSVGDELADGTQPKMSRGRSNGTHNSRVTKGTRSTRSSRDTKSTFESNWRKNEQLYWTEQVDYEEEKPESQMEMSPSRQRQMLKKARDWRGRSRSRSSELRKPLDATITTAGSTTLHSESPFSAKHPHETFHFDANDFFPSTETINANRQVQASQDYTDYTEDPDRIMTDQEVLLLAQDSEFAEI